MVNNVYLDFSSYVYSTLKDRYNDYNSVIIPASSTKKVKTKFGREKEIEIQNKLFVPEYNDELDARLNSIKGWEKTTNPVMKFFEFAKFIRIAEKIYLYNNSDDKALYADSNLDEEDKELSTYQLFLSDDDYKIRTSYKNSDISNFSSDNMLDDYLNGDSNKKKYLTLVSIEVKRTYGKNMCNKYNFTLSDLDSFGIPDYVKSEDSVLLNTIYHLINKEISNTFDNIMNTIASIFIDNISYENNWKVALTYEQFKCV